MPVPSWLAVLAFAVVAATAPGLHGQYGDPLTLEEEASLREIRDFAEKAAAHYRMLAPLEVSVAPWVGTGSLPQYATAPAVYTRGALYLSRRVLRAPDRYLVIA